MASAPIVLLPGGSLGTWVWDDVRARLPGPTLALDLPGRESETRRRTATLPDLIAQAAQDIAQAGDCVTLVAHSLGGIVASGVAAAHPDRVRHVVYVGSVLPLPGASFLTYTPQPVQTLLRVMYRMKPAGLLPPAKLMRNDLCRGLDEATKDRLVEGAMPEAPALFTQDVTWRHPAGVPSTYVLLKDDAAIPEATQRAAIQALPEARVEELASGHVPMLSHPDELARIIAEAAAPRKAVAVPA